MTSLIHMAMTADMPDGRRATVHMGSETVTFIDVLQAVLIGLKLAGLLDAGWHLVLLPIIIAIVLCPAQLLVECKLLGISASEVWETIKRH